MYSREAVYRRIETHVCNRAVNMMHVRKKRKKKVKKIGFDIRVHQHRFKGRKSINQIVNIDNDSYWGLFTTHCPYRIVIHHLGEYQTCHTNMPRTMK